MSIEPSCTFLSVPILHSLSIFTSGAKETIVKISSVELTFGASIRVGTYVADLVCVLFESNLGGNCLFLIQTPLLSLRDLLLYWITLCWLSDDVDIQAAEDIRCPRSHVVDLDIYYVGMCCG